jgi:GNAT superfamily N-acetyltransferase
MYELIPVATAPELDEEAGKRFVEEWPEFIFHDPGVAVYRERRRSYFLDWEFYLVSVEDRRLIGGCWGVPIAWDETVGDLPGGFTDALGRAVESREAGVVPDTFVLMAAAVRNDEQGKGHAGRVITAVKEQAALAGLTRMIAPVRPTLKSRYPLTDIAEFMTWTRPDGLPLDPWLRTHVRLGARLLAGAGVPDDDRHRRGVGEVDRARAAVQWYLRDPRWPGRPGGRPRGRSGHLPRAQHLATSRLNQLAREPGR